MIDAGDSVAAFIAGRQRGDLDQDRMLLFAFVRGIEVVGEAASRLSDEAQSRSSTIPWRSIVSMRNRLVHGYFDVDPDLVWRTATEELPALLPLLRELATTD